MDSKGYPSKSRGRIKNHDRNRRREFKPSDSLQGYYTFDGKKMVFHKETPKPCNIAQQSSTGGVLPTNYIPPPPSNDNMATPESHATETTDYISKRRKISNKWKDLQGDMVQQMVKRAYPASFECCLCKDGKKLDIIYRCLDCGPHAYFCLECCNAHHEVSLLHRAEVWDPQAMTFEECNNRHTWTHPSHHDTCLSGAISEVIIIDEKGRQHYQALETCQCMPLAVSMVAYGLWPASPSKPGICFTLDFMENLRAVVLEGQISVQAYVSALQQCRVGLFRCNTLEWVPDIYRIITWESILHYMWVRHNVRNLQFADNSYQDGTQCPACPGPEGSDQRRMTMDGNFTLVHRTKAGRSVRDPLHEGRFFLAQSEVDAFVDADGISDVTNKNCSNFQVMSVLRSKNKTTKLDVTGTFASVCSHDFPAKIMNIRYGERMAYPILMTQSVPNVSLWMYDIGCQLHSTLQVQYSPRCTEGAGLFDGEGTERLWSYLGRFNLITKEMKMENRTDLLTEALLNYGEKLSMNMGMALCRKLTKASLLKETTTREIEKEIRSIQGGVTMAGIIQWEQEERQRIASHHAQEEQSWESTYAMLLFHYYHERDDDEDDDESDARNDKNEARILSSLRRIEKSHGVTTRWASSSLMYKHHLEVAVALQRRIELGRVREAAIEYSYMQSLRAKYASGQSLAKRITKQVLRASQRVNETMSKYNKLPAVGNEDLPHRLIREEVVRLDAAVWQHLLPSCSGSLGVPLSLKRTLIDGIRLNKRAEEEIACTLKDMQRLYKSLCEQQDLLNQEVSMLKDLSAPTALQLGTISLLVRRLQDIVAYKESVKKVVDKVDAPGSISLPEFTDSLELENSHMLPADMPKQSLLSLLQEIDELEGEGMAAHAPDDMDMVSVEF